MEVQGPSAFILSLMQQSQEGPELLKISHCQERKAFNVNYCNNPSKTKCSSLQSDHTYTRGLSKAVSVHD